MSSEPKMPHVLLDEMNKCADEFIALSPDLTPGKRMKQVLIIGEVTEKMTTYSLMAGSNDFFKTESGHEIREGYLELFSRFLKGDLSGEEFKAYGMEKLDDLNKKTIAQQLKELGVEE
jgi:hypothetical protein